jgi:hypothetical protein
MPVITANETLKQYWSYHIINKLQRKKYLGNYIKFEHFLKKTPNQLKQTTAVLSGILDNGRQ